MAFTVKAKLSSKLPSPHGFVQLLFTANYEGDANKEWAMSTPAFVAQMNVKPELAESIPDYAGFTLTFNEEVD